MKKLNKKELSKINGGGLAHSIGRALRLFWIGALKEGTPLSVNTAAMGADEGLYRYNCGCSE